MKLYLKYSVILFAMVVSSCTSVVRYVSEPIHISSEKQAVAGEAITSTNTDNKIRQTGIASYYADKFHGRKTSSGEIYDKNEFTAAHREFPFGTKVKVTNLSNNLSVVVRINDRGPQTTKRLIDLSRAAAEEIDMIRAGIIEVEIEIVD
jgi:rare lipoprotein A